MKRSSLVALVSLLCWSVAAAEEAKFGSVAFILDCSRSMAEAAEDHRTVRQTSSESPTRMEAATALLDKMLDELAADGNARVALWLYGHRLVWQQDAQHPELLSQDAYLEATVGFAALNGLLPGDDVEQAQPIKRFTQQENRQLAVRLATLKPWGEKPLYLALTRAVDSLADEPATTPKCIIVLTDGGNEQWLARYKTNYDRVSRLLRNNLVPIHFIHFGPEDNNDDDSHGQLRELAEQGGGSLVHAGAGTELSVAQVISDGRKAPAASALTGSEEGDEAGAAARPARPAPRTISGSVVYYGRPVTTATITLEGTDIPAVKADRQGRFLIRNVPAGRRYKIVVNAVARNHAREKTLDLDVGADSQEQPFLSIDVK